MSDSHAINVTMKRRKYWIINAFLYYFQQLPLFNKKRNKRLWIFGAWNGDRYDDNSRYLFEYVNQECKDIKTVWLSNNIEIIKKVQSKGYCAEIASSRKGIEIQKKAGVAFYTNGFDDFGDICYIYGAKIVALWHGTGFKKIYYNEKHYGGVKYFLKRLKDAVYLSANRDITISSSKYCTYVFRTAFKINPQTIYLTGFPRYDALLQSYKKSDVLFKEKQAEKYKYILYMPTYRPYQSSIIEDTIKNLAQNSEFISFLEGSNTKLLLKLHYLTNIEDIKLPDNIKILRDSDISSVQELLSVSDVLFTDYSSVIVDFAVMNKPSLIYCPDYEKYTSLCGILDEGVKVYKEYSKTDIDDLISSLKNSILHPSEELNLTRKINSLFLDPALFGSCYSKNVVEMVRKLI